MKSLSLKITPFVILSFIAACSDARVGVKSRDAAAEPVITVGQRRLDALKSDSAKRATIVRVPRPAVVRGLYVNRWAAVGKKLGQLIDIAKTTEVNALVTDVKYDRGFV